MVCLNFGPEILDLKTTISPRVFFLEKINKETENRAISSVG
jgi:hypothetical protein